jgi:multidrug efflux pump subunit AcrA (membrane-fusion protein)
VQNSNFKIEAFVPEADIAKVAIDDVASTTLDAYGSNVDFPSRVVMIDPAETVVEGVPTYKVTLEFINPDIRIRSGMTANLTIHTHEALGVLYIPFRSVIDNNGSHFVRVVNAGGKSYATTTVEVGLKGSDGNIQIISGIKEGDSVVTYIK